MAFDSEAGLRLLIDVSIKSLLLAALVAVALRFAPRLHANLRHRVWLAVLAGMLLLPALELIVPPAPLPSGLSILATASSESPPATIGVADLADARAFDAVTDQANAPSHETVSQPAPKNGTSGASQSLPMQNREQGSPSERAVAEIAPSPIPIASSEPASSRIAWPSWLISIYLAGALWMLARLAVGFVAAWRLVRCATPISRPLPCRTRVAASNSLRVPVTVGLFRPWILLPADWASWDADLLAAALAHEQAHVDRGDHLALWAAELNRCLYWFHPAAWFLRRRLAALAEQCCDDAVIAASGDRPGYAKSLLKMAGRLNGSSRRTVALGVSMARTSRVGSRVESILDQRRPLAQRLGARRAAAICFVIAPMVLLAAALRADDQESNLKPEPSSSAGAQPADEKAAPAPVPEPITELTQLIAKVREQEARFGDYSAKLVQSREFAPPENNGPIGRPAIGSSPVRGTIEINRQSVQGQQFKLLGEDTALLDSGEKPTATRVSVCDGTKTVSIDAGASAMIHAGRVEPPQMLLPHDWGVFHLEVNFPLSVYLGGTEAMKSCLKVRRHPAESGSVYEFYKAEAKLLDDEQVDGLDCVKVRVQRWHYTTDPPTIQYLWLAKDRNYHVAQTRTARIHKNIMEIPSQESRVTKWRRLAADLWAPVAIEVLNISPEAKKKQAEPKSDRRLLVEDLTLNPRLPAETFALPKIPATAVVFEFSADGRLTGSPHHPTPVAAEPGLTLETILTRLAAEEAKYDRLEVLSNERFVMLNQAELQMGGLATGSESQQRSVLSGDRLLFEEMETMRVSDGRTFANSLRQAYDGRRLREVRSQTSGVYESKPQFSASLWLGRPHDMKPLHPHTLMFRWNQSRQSLAAFLRSGRVKGPGSSAMTVEYVDDEQIDDLHCHKLRCEFQQAGRKIANDYSFVWLARDRNLLAVQRRVYQPGRHETLPTHLNYLEDLREIKPGVWYPRRSIDLSFQDFGRDGLSASRIVLEGRREITIDSVIVDAAPDESLFTTVDVPSGTRVGVLDEEGKLLGDYKQPVAGNINIAPDELQAMRQKAQVSREEADRRQKALDALIGQQAPELPREAWLNSQPLAWQDLAGKVVVIDFWAVWCGPCEPDLRRLADMHKTWQENGITDRVLLGIHTTGSEPDAVAKTAKDKKLGYPIVIDRPAPKGEASFGELFQKFAVRQIPFAMVVDGSGKIVAHGRLEEMLWKAHEVAEQAEAKKAAEAKD